MGQPETVGKSGGATVPDELRVIGEPPGQAGVRVSDLPAETLAAAVLGVGWEAGWEAHVEELAGAGLGAVILFGSALTDPVAAARHISRLQAAAWRGPLGVPLLVGADEEGGRVARLPRGPASSPGAAALGEAGDPALAEEAGRATALRLAAVGINWDLAPVCDLGRPDSSVLAGRAFGPEPEVAARLAAAFARGLEGQGVVACGKHFPGHGGTSADTHQTGGTVEATLEELRTRAWRPFTAVVQAGAGTMMMGHLTVPALDRERPASLSAASYLALRRELGFAGPIATDSLGMAGSARAAGSVGEAAVLALGAGADIILVGHGIREQLEARDRIAEALRSGRVPMARAWEAVTRVVRLKAERHLARRPLPDPEAVPHLLERPSDIRLAREIARRAVVEFLAGPEIPAPATLRAGPDTPASLREAAGRRWPHARWREDGGGRALILDERVHLFIGAPRVETAASGRVLVVWDGAPASVEALLDRAQGERP